MNQQLHIALCFLNFGPYHYARLDACLAKGFSVTGVQLAPLQSEYGWNPTLSSEVVSIHQGTLEEIPAHRWPALVFAALDRLNPDICAVAGYGHPGMRSILAWCKRRKRPVVMMSDSRHEDRPRTRWKELVKSVIIKSCSAGLVAGTPHVAYMKSMGLPEEKIFTGYDVVDNEYFAQRADEAKLDKELLRQKFDLPENYFLASARLIEKKNLPSLLEAYAKYRQSVLCSDDASAVPWDLVLLGDGPLRPSLCRLITELGLESSVKLPGFVQYEELPIYYALAQSFVLTSHMMEQWGLVVNEAMASGLPVLVSNACGCASDLVEDGLNGFTFDPHNTDSLADLMIKIADMTPDERADMGLASQRMISHWEPSHFASGLKQAVDCSFATNSTQTAALDLLSLGVLAACR